MSTPPLPTVVYKPPAVTSSEKKERGVPNIHHYRRARLLGKGNFGRVFVARGRDGKEYAIKEMNMAGIGEKLKERAIWEVKVTSEASGGHPFIIDYVEAMCESNTVYIVMEYASGGNLKHKLETQVKAGKLWSEWRIRRYLLQILLAVKGLHDNHILHRDLKTENLFLAETDDVKLGDFGLARALSAFGQKSTYAVTSAGTPGYIAPEILMNQRYDYKADIWSVGIILYELSTGRLPFHPNNRYSVINQQHQPLPTHLSAEFRHQINAMLRKNPHNRPSVDELLQSELMRETFERELSAEQKRAFDPNGRFLIYESRHGSEHVEEITRQIIGSVRALDFSEMDTQLGDEKADSQPREEYILLQPGDEIPEDSCIPPRKDGVVYLTGSNAEDTDEAEEQYSAAIAEKVAIEIARRRELGENIPPGSHITYRSYATVPPTVITFAVDEDRCSYLSSLAGNGPAGEPETLKQSLSHIAENVKKSFNRPPSVDESLADSESVCSSVPSAIRLQRLRKQVLNFGHDGPTGAAVRPPSPSATTETTEMTETATVTESCVEPHGLDDVTANERELALYDDTRTALQRLISVIEAEASAAVAEEALSKGPAPAPRRNLSGDFAKYLAGVQPPARERDDVFDDNDGEDADIDEDHDTGGGAGETADVEVVKVVQRRPEPSQPVPVPAASAAHNASSITVASSHDTSRAPASSPDDSESNERSTWVDSSYLDSTTASTMNDSELLAPLSRPGQDAGRAATLAADPPARPRAETSPNPTTTSAAIAALPTAAPTAPTAAPAPTAKDSVSSSVSSSSSFTRPTAGRAAASPRARPASPPRSKPHAAPPPQTATPQIVSTRPGSASTSSSMSSANTSCSTDSSSARRPGRRAGRRSAAAAAMAAAADDADEESSAVDLSSVGDSSLVAPALQLDDDVDLEIGPPSPLRQRSVTNGSAADILARIGSQRASLANVNAMGKGVSSTSSDDDNDESGVEQAYSQPSVVTYTLPSASGAPATTVTYSTDPVTQEATVTYTNNETTPPMVVTYSVSAPRLPIECESSNERLDPETSRAPSAHAVVVEAGPDADVTYQNGLVERDPKSGATRVARGGKRMPKDPTTVTYHNHATGAVVTYNIGPETSFCPNPFSTAFRSLAATAATSPRRPATPLTARRLGPTDSDAINVSPPRRRAASSASQASGTARTPSSAAVSPRHNVQQSAPSTTRLGLGMGASSPSILASGAQPAPPPQPPQQQNRPFVPRLRPGSSPYMPFGSIGAYRPDDEHSVASSPPSAGKPGAAKSSTAGMLRSISSPWGNGMSVRPPGGGFGSRSQPRSPYSYY